MQHPFDVLKDEYTRLLAAMQVRPECVAEVDNTATRLLTHRSRYAEVTAIDGVPVVFIAASFEREAGSNFNLNPAQGAPLHKRSTIIPHNGPFPDWKTAALAAYKLDGLDQVGAENWTWELICYYGEAFNGFGYRDYHHMHSPYLWGGSNIQTAGKYTADGQFDSAHMDTQLGIIPVARRMVELDSTLALAVTPYVPAPPIASGIAAEQDGGIAWVQESLNKLGFGPLVVDSSYGRRTALAIRQFQDGYGLDVDGMVGPQTTAALRAALALLSKNA